MAGADNVSGGQVLVGSISVLVVVVCVLFHYEIMSRTSWLLPRVGHLPRRARIVVVILAMLAAHVVEVWLFGLTYWVPLLKENSVNQ